MGRICEKSPIYSDHMYSKATSQPYPRHCLFCHKSEVELEQVVSTVQPTPMPVKQIAAIEVQHNGQVNGYISVANLQEFRQAMHILNSAEHLFERGGS